MTAQARPAERVIRSVAYLGGRYDYCPCQGFENGRWFEQADKFFFLTVTPNGGPVFTCSDAKLARHTIDKWAKPGEKLHAIHRPRGRTYGPPTYEVWRKGKWRPIPRASASALLKSLSAQVVSETFL